MPQELVNILWSAFGLIITSLITWGFFELRSFVARKKGDSEEAKKINTCLEITEDAVKEVFQIYVEALKKEGKFTKECHEKAKAMAIDMILNRLTPALKDYLDTKYGEAIKWISNQIETVIYTLKQN